MSERPFGVPERQFTVEIDDVLLDESRWEEFRDERLEAIRAGEKVWMPRAIKGLSSGKERGYVFDFYWQVGWKGYVDGNDRDGYFTYRPPTEEEKDEIGPSLVLLNVTEPYETLGQAQKALEDYTKETSIE
ncbi:MAG TPA: hypothetical protein VFW52_00110 [Candidatus Saccharimonadales bacterium]|nr:hypothetical protein [Candidatus Saccharimonadales bacterium]